MTDLDPAELAQFVKLSTAAIGLPIPIELEAAVMENAAILAGHAARVMACDIPPETEIATEFHP